MCGHTHGDFVIIIIIRSADILVNPTFIVYHYYIYYMRSLSVPFRSRPNTLLFEPETRVRLYSPPRESDHRQGQNNVRMRRADVGRQTIRTRAERRVLREKHNNISSRFSVNDYYENCFFLFSILIAVTIY